VATGACKAKRRGGSRPGLPYNDRGRGRGPRNVLRGSRRTPPWSDSVEANPRSGWSNWQRGRFVSNTSQPHTPEGQTTGPHATVRGHRRARRNPLRKVGTGWLAGPADQRKGGRSECGGDRRVGPTRKWAPAVGLGLARVRFPSVGRIVGLGPTAHSSLLYFFFFSISTFRFEFKLKFVKLGVLILDIYFYIYIYIVYIFIAFIFFLFPTIISI
jgi:hypothetical protein